MGQKTEVSRPARHVRFTLGSRHRQAAVTCPFGANFGSREAYSITSSARASSVGFAGLRRFLPSKFHHALLTGQKFQKREVTAFRFLDCLSPYVLAPIKS